MEEWIARLTRRRRVPNSEKRVPTDWGDFRGYVEWDLNENNDGNVGVKCRHAYGTWTTTHGMLLVGQAWSTMMDMKILPESLTGPTASGLIFQRQPIIRWSQPSGFGFIFHVAAEDPSSNDVSADTPDLDLVNTQYPDGVVGLEFVREGKGHLRSNGIVRYLEARRPINRRKTSDVGWGLALTRHMNVWERDRAMFSAIYGQGLGRDLLGIQRINGARRSENDGLELCKNWGGMTAFEHHWIENLRSTAMLGFARASGRPGDPGGTLREFGIRLGQADVEPFALVHGRRRVFLRSSREQKRLGSGQPPRGDRLPGLLIRSREERPCIRTPFY